MLFETLDSSISEIRIVLLVQIGKEGWDCRSLTGIILSQEGDCPKNMVLQTACRCLRQVEKGSPETALIYLNDANAAKLNAQLQQQHHISLKELQSGDAGSRVLNRYDRMAYLKLPPIDYYQLRVNFVTQQLETANPVRDIEKADEDAKIAQGIVKTTDLTMEVQFAAVEDVERGNLVAVFSYWLLEIVKGSFGTLTMELLRPHEKALRRLFEKITYERENVRYFSSKYDHKRIEANVRKAFCDSRSFTTTEELLPQSSSLLNIEHFTDTVRTTNPESYYPNQERVRKIHLADAGQLKIKPEVQALMDLARKAGETTVLELLRKQNEGDPQRNRSFHYMPYHTDSPFERIFLDQVLRLEDVERLNLEVYYNGDRALTEFKIKCYKWKNNAWQYVGMYTPDFLIVKRKDGQIYKAIIVETKGRIYANDPSFREKRAFTEGSFIRENNRKFGYRRFEYLYLEDTLPEAERIRMTQEKICAFFEEE